MKDACSMTANPLEHDVAADGPPPLGLHLLTGVNTPEKFQNYAMALDDRQIEPIIMIATRS
jgi:hypothetical protein